MIHCFLKKQSDSLLKFTCFVVFAFAGFVANAQEADCSVSANCSDPYCNYPADTEKGCNCFDNVDNDGDGKIDIDDSDCATYHGLSFVGEDADCSIIPPGANTPFDLVGIPVASAQNTADTQSKVSVGDVDGDGIPDGIITSKWNSEIRVVATADGQADGTAAGQIKSSYKTTGPGAKIFSGSGGCSPKNLLFEHENLIADIDKDGKAELFAVVSNRSGNPDSPPTCFFLVGFKYAKSTLVPLYNAVQIGVNRPGTFGIADMDGDGKAEIYLRDRIYAAETGALLAAANGDWDLDVTSGPVAVDISGDSKLELVCGTKIYSIPSLTNRNPASPAALTLVNDMNTITSNKAYVKLWLDPAEYGTDTHSMCSVADIDKDGSMDVVISGALNAVNGPTAVFYWNVAKGTVSYYLPGDPSYANGWPWGTGRVNLGDANGDGRMDLSFITGARLHCLTTDASGNLVPLWAAPRVINDSRSGVLTVSIYDFNNDGQPEMVYRDSQELAVIDGATGTQKLWSAVCQSHTYTEGPVIADVNGDGSTDICVSCNTSNSFNINDGIQQQALGQFRLYYSSGNEWLPTRKVWNQPGYFVVNVKDDLTLPFPQLDQSMVFGTEDCLNGLPGPQTPMNMFLNQIPYLSASGCPVYPAPDLSFVGDNPDNPGVDSNGDGIYTPTVEVTPPVCGEIAIGARFNIINDGDMPLSGDIPVSFFVGDPTDPSITSDSLIHSTFITISNLEVDSTFTSPYITFNGPGTAFRLYIVLNNDGSVLPIDPNGSVSNECRIDNNIYSVYIQPDPFTTKIEKIQDNYKCSDAAPDNGELRVRIFKGATEVTDYSEYAFQWHTGTTASYTPIDGATNYNIIGLAEGDYTAIVTNTAKGCAGLPVDTTVVRLGNDPEVIINVISHQTVCNPPNGELQAEITGGNSGYTFEWFDNALNALGITGPTATNLTAGNYLVRVSKDGCSKNSPPQTVDGPTVPDAQASTVQHIVDCLDPNSGSVTATALFNGAPQDPAKYTFDWYFYDNATATRGSILPPENGTGETRIGLPVGHYQVVVTDTATQCKAIQAPITEITSQTVIPTAVITELAPQTSCDPATPNGRLAGDVQTGGVTQDPANYTFEWFEGDNTLPENVHSNVSGVNGRIAEGVSGGGLIYTIKVTTANNCSDTEKIIITEDLNVPVITLAKTDNTICDPALAASDYNGSVSASVTFDGVAITDFTNYQITWHDGPLNTDPVITGATASTLSQRDGGYYTVVIKRTDLSCISDPATAQVKNVTVLPAITSDSVPSTNCDPALANGQARVTDVDGLGTGAPYIFQWHTGIDTSAPVSGATNAIITDLQGGIGQNFTVLVTNQNTGCQNTSTVAVPDAKIIPSVTLNPSPNTICNPALTDPSVQYNGSVLSTITNQGSFPVEDYQFTWTDEEDGSQILQATGTPGKDILNRDSSSYTLNVKQLSSGCEADPVTAQVLANTVLPVITADANASTNCDPALANGQAVVTDVDSGGGIGAPYVFQWHKGNDIASPLTGETNALLDKRQGGSGEFYTVLVTNQTDGCQNTSTVEIPDARVLPLFTLAAQPNTICDKTLTDPSVEYNGSVTATITNLIGVTGDYTFTWTDKETNTTIPAVTGPDLLNRDTSYYTAVVLHVPTGCISDPVTAQVTPDFTLPTITANANASTNCDPDLANGQAEVTDVDGAGTAAPYVFLWHEGNDISTALAGETNALLDKRQGGAGEFYTVLVTNQDDGCQSTRTLEIPDARVLPLVTLLASPNSVCDSVLAEPDVAYNGSVAATISNMGIFPITDYHFTWTDEEDGAMVFDKDGGGTNLGETLVNRDTSYYTVIAKQISTGCVSSPVSAEVTSDFSFPVITANANASTNCEPALANGQAVITDVDGAGTIAPYVFQWHDGNDTTSPLASETNPLLDNRQGGAGEFYTVLVTNQNDGCQNTHTVEIPDASVLPLFTLAAQPNTICDASLTDPSISYNGRVDATITNQGTFLISDYQFDWTDEEISAVVFSASGGGATLGESLVNRDSSYYTLVIEQVSTGCVSDPVTAQVTPDFTLPTITANANASTNCDPALANGQAVVTDIDSGGGTAAPYVFQWHKGNDTSSPLTAETNPLLDKRQGGAGEFYTVLVTNQNDGCQNTHTVEIPDIKELPLFTLATTPNTICDSTLTIPAVSYDGTVSATITNLSTPIEDYHFTWTDEEDGAVVFDATGGGTSFGESLINRDTSFYSLVITQVSTGCVSDTVAAQVKPNFFIPVIDIADVLQTSCDPANPNGELLATVDETSEGGTSGITANYVFDWHKDNLSGAAVTTTGAGPWEIISLAGNVSYAVEVTSQATGCRNASSFYLGETIVIPAASLAASPQTFCNPPDGEITATVTPAPSGTYTFYWLKEEPFTTTTDPSAVITAVDADQTSPNRKVTGAVSAATDTHSGLFYGDYTFVVVDNYTACISATYTATVEDKRQADINFPTVVQPASCAAAEGKLDLQASRKDGAPTNFTFDVYLGGPTNTVTPINFYTNPPVFDMTVNDGATAQPAVTFPQNYGGVPSGSTVTVDSLKSSLYSVVTTDDYGCKNLKTIFLPFLDAHEIDAVFTNSQICPYTIGDGSISVKAIPPPPNPEVNQSQFTFRFYKGGAANPANAITMSSTPGPEDPTIESGSGQELCGNGIDDDNDGLVDNVIDCSGVDQYGWPTSLEICNNGIDDDGDGLTDNDDPDCSGRVAARNLVPGFYTVEIEEKISGQGCKIYEVIEIDRDALPPLISLVGMTPNTACDMTGADGQFTMNIARAPGDPVVTKYDFDVTSVPFSPPTYSFRNAGNFPFTDLQPATYTVSVEGRSTGCKATKDFTVLNNPAIAQVADKVITDAEFCDPALEASARVEITRLRVSGKTEICGNGIDDDGDTFIDNDDPDCNDNLADYTFEWFTDAAVSQTVQNPLAGNNGGDGGEVLANNGAPLNPVTTGAYYVVATKTKAGMTGGFGCASAPFKVDIGDKTVTPAVVLHPFGNTSCDDNFEGRIEIAASTADLGYPAPYKNPGATGTFRYEWDAANPDPRGTTTGNNGNRNNIEPDRDVEGNLRPGTYNIIAINEATGCRVSAAATIQKISPPLFTLSLSSQPQNICDPSGSIQVNDAFLDGASNGTGNFDYFYFAGDPNTTALAVPNTPLLDVTSYATIKAGTYYVVATRKTDVDPGSGCSSAPHRVDIMNTSKDPVATLTPYSNTSCDNMIFEGSINITVTDPGSALTTSYTYNWSGANPSPVASPASGDGDGDVTEADGDYSTDLKDGTYEVTITNDASGCFVNAQTTILKTAVPVIITQATPSPQVVCNPDGSITVNNVTVDGVNVANTDFDFTWYRDNLSTQIVAAAPGEDVLDAGNYTAIGAGTYFVKAKRTASEPGYQCESAPLQVNIEDNTEDPTVVLTPLANTSCDPSGNFEGSISLRVTDPGSAPSATYTYDWDDANNPMALDGGTPIGGNNGDGDGTDPDGDNPIDLKDGTYNVTIINDASGCFVNAQTTILKTEVPIVIAQATPLPQVICNPDGSIAVNNVTVNGVSVVNSDFDFTWYRNDLATEIIAATPGEDVLDVKNYATIGAGTYFVKAKRTTSEPGYYCESAPLRVNIEDDTEDPTVVLTPSSNTSCDNLIFEGSILVDVTDPGSAVTGTYTYDWDEVANPSDVEGGSGPVSANDDLSGTDDNPIDLKDGVYRLTITNDASGCFVNAQTTILKTETPIIIAEATALPQLICNPDGSITVADVMVGGVSVVNTDFEFTWFRDDLTNQLTLPTSNEDILNVGNYASIGAGTYFVRAKRVTGEPAYQCESAPVRVDIKDARVKPLVSFATISNTSCDNNFDAQITVTSQVSSGPGVGANYDLTWITVPPPATVANAPDQPSPYTTLASDNVGPGTYTIRSMNRATQCLTQAAVTINSNPQPLDILTVDKQDQMICNPDGSITVSAMSPASVADYSFTWHRSAPGSTALTDGGGPTIDNSMLNAGNYPSMGADTYYVVGKKNADNNPGSGCLTPPFRVEVKDLHEDPLVQFAFQPNSSCDDLNPNGQVIATAQESDGTPDNYSFKWLLDGNELPAVTTQSGASPQSQLDKAYEGRYILTTTNTITGCLLTSSLDVNKNLTISRPNIITIDTVDPLDCLGSGRAEVTAVSIGGKPPITGPALSMDFEYEWYRDAYLPANELPNTAPLLEDLQPGKFYVMVRNLITQCQSKPPTETVIAEDDVVYPAVTVTQTQLQISCPSTNGTGELTALADGQDDSNLDYSFSWYNNLTATGSAFNTINSTVNNLISGDYSVAVKNATTGCTTTKVYIIPNEAEKFLPQISLTTQVRVNCLVNDGLLLAREVGYNPNSGYPFSPDYTAEIYPGANADVSQPGIVMTNISGFNRNWEINSLDVGIYTVKITDNNTACMVTGMKEVFDGRTAPVITIIEDNPLINCDPARPNGQLSATADRGPVGRYQFNWYDGAAASGAVIADNNKLIAIPLGVYTVRVTNKTTNCFADAQGSVTDGRLLPPTPTALRIFDRAHCQYPDGWVAANVGGVTFNYSFDWYDGSAVKNTPDFNGVNYKDRDIGLYSVTAMDQTTGCTSLPASVEVKDLRVIPEVLVTTTPSYCDELPGSAGGNGFAEIQLSPANVISDEVTWSLVPNPNTIGIGSYITGIFPGFYQANVLTSYGCEASGVGEVKTEVFPYSLLSANGDRKNDNFMIDCISQFPDNSVKIFNRAGVLVYEANGYNNNEVVFKGIGEKGVYTIGNELPVGTYFYIIDKRDGSKPKTGYLELVK